jgi:RimJ/RimL family protein N-acetyltransferase
MFTNVKMTLTIKFKTLFTIRSAIRSRMVELSTPRLRLRRATPADLEAFHAILSDPRAMTYWSTLPHETLDQTHDWLAGMIDTPTALGDDFVIERDGRAIGKAGCWRLPDIGYILHPDAWGQGYAVEALSAVIAHLLARPDVTRLTADVDPRNDASLRLLAKLGFAVTHTAARTWHVGDVWQDSVYLALERQPAPALAGETG